MESSRGKQAKFESFQPDKEHAGMHMSLTKLYTTVCHHLSNPLPLSIIILCRVSPSKIADPLKTRNWRLLMFFSGENLFSSFAGNLLTSCLVGPL